MIKKNIKIIFEAGPTHNGFKSAKKLIFYSALAKADAIKFQIIDADEIMPDKNIKIEYKYYLKKKLVSKESSINKLLKNRMLSYDKWKKLKLYCDDLGIEFMATVGSEKDINFLKKLNCKEIKISSGDLNYTYLVEKAAKSGMGLHIDTGGGNLSEIKKTVRLIRKFKNKNIVIHHCPPGYPTNHKDINLNILKALKKEFKTKIGFSDHSPGPDISLLAAKSKNVDIIEKTITENKYTKSIEHAMSLEIHELQKFVNSIKDIESKAVDYKKIINKNILNKEKIIFGNKKNYLKTLSKKSSNKVRRSAYLNKNAKKNTLIKNLKLFFARPGYGLSYDDVKKYKNLRLRLDLKKNQNLKNEHIS